MAIYREHVLPWIINVACGMKQSKPLRERVCEGLQGRVVEIGFGSGLNVPFYPQAVTGVSAVEPADLAWKLAHRRLEDSTIPVERAGLDGESLPFEDDSFDTAISTWTLCTIPDAGRHCGRFGASSSPAAPFTSSSTASHRTRRFSGGRTG